MSEWKPPPGADAPIDPEERAFREALLKGEVPPHPDPSKGCIRRGLCCRTNPGWFGPGEVEQAAAFLGMDVDDFVRTYVIIDRVEVDGARVEVFVPVKRGRGGVPVAQPGTRVDALYSMFPSPCIFFVDNGCRIYGARPSECRAYLCTRPASENLSHEAIGRMWRDGVVADPD